MLIYYNRNIGLSITQSADSPSDNKIGTSKTRMLEIACKEFKSRYN